MPQGAPTLMLPGSLVDLRSPVGALCALRLALAALMGIPVTDVRLAVAIGSASGSVIVLTNDCTSMGAALAASTSRTLSDVATLRGLATSACGAAATGAVGTCGVAPAPALPSPPPAATSTAPLTSMQVIVMIPASNSSLLTSTSLCSSLALSSGDPGTTPASGGALSSLRSVAGVTMMLSIPSGQSVAGCTSNIISDLALLDPAQAPVGFPSAAGASSTTAPPASPVALIAGVVVAGVVLIAVGVAGIAYAGARTRLQQRAPKVITVTQPTADGGIKRVRLASSSSMRHVFQEADAKQVIGLSASVAAAGASAAYVNPLLHAQAAAAHHERAQQERAREAAKGRVSDADDVALDASGMPLSPGTRAGFAPTQRKRGGADNNSMRGMSNF